MSKFDPSSNVHAVILAAGQGTRMRSARPKVLHAVAGTPMLGHVIAAVRSAGAAHCHVVLGHEAEVVRRWLASVDPEINVVLQTAQLGTAHAVRQAMPLIPDDGVVVVLCGDVPLIRARTIRQLTEAARNGLALVTAKVGNSHGYGRILRNPDGNIKGIVEEKDATAQQRGIREINAGLVGAPAVLLRRLLERVNNDNASGEYYLPDVVALAVRDGIEVKGVTAVSEEEITGVNDRRQLAAAEKRYQHDKAEELMAAGLQLLDPARFALRGELQFGRDVCIDVDCVLEGKIELGDDVSIEPGVVMRNVRVGCGSTIRAYSVLEEAVVGSGCRIGPFARLRPGAELGADVHVGNFVEVKNARMGTGSKANHLAYVGDAEVGERVNIGAGVITCNYDGVSKQRTVIGDDAFIGTDSQLIAPVTIGARAYIAAGSTIARNAPDDALTICRPRDQTSVPGWKPKIKK